MATSYSQEFKDQIVEHASSEDRSFMELGTRSSIIAPTSIFELGACRGPARGRGDSASKR